MVMMKAVWVFLLTISLQSICFADNNVTYPQNITIRDKYGNVTGHVYSTSKNSSVERDKYGNVVRYYSKAGNELHVYDKYGNYTGSYRK